MHSHIILQDFMKTIISFYKSRKLSLRLSAIMARTNDYLSAALLKSCFLDMVEPS